MQSGDCWTCRHSESYMQASVRRFITHRGYVDERGDEKRGFSIICPPRKRVRCRPCGKYEREPGSDEE